MRSGAIEQTLGIRLVLSYAVVFVASTVLLAVLAYVLFTHFMREPDRSFMRSQALEIAESYAGEGLTGLRRELMASPSQERLEELLVRLAAPDGTTRLLYNPDSWTRGEIEQLAAHPIPAEPTWISLGQAEDQDALEAYVMRLSDGTILQVGMDAELRADALASMRSVFFAIAIPVFLLAIGAGALMSYRAMRPVRSLVSTLHAVIDTGDVEMRVPTAGARGEFVELIHLFNRMVDRIENLVTGMRATLDNVAHDLRTPMTRLRGRAELALQNEADPEVLRDVLAENVEEADSVLALLETLMEVAEAEAGVMSLQLEWLDASALVADVVELYDLVAEERGVSISASVPSPVRIQADRSRLRRALANLVDNAVKYTPEGGAVVVSAASQDGAVELRVADDGPGIPAAERTRIWDRLYRGDTSRSARGLGLGLSLVRAIALAHGGSVDARERPEGGSLFTIRLPQAGRDGTVSKV